MIDDKTHRELETLLREHISGRYRNESFAANLAARVQNIIGPAPEPKLVIALRYGTYPEVYTNGNRQGYRMEDMYNGCAITATGARILGTADLDVVGDSVTLSRVEKE